MEPNEDKIIGNYRVIFVSRNDSKYNKIGELSKVIYQKYKDLFFLFWKIHRHYDNKELISSKLLRIIMNKRFEPAGEECGTFYNESVACNICGANRAQSGPLKLMKNSIPNKDISKTIAGEVIVSQKFVFSFKHYGLKGASFKPVYFGKILSNYYQPIITSPSLKITDKTIGGVDPFDFSEAADSLEINIQGYKTKLGMEIYKCPSGHTIGLKSSF